MIADSCCPACSARLAPDARFCRSCGESLSDVAPSATNETSQLACRECGAALATGASFCRVCGSGVADGRRASVGTGRPVGSAAPYGHSRSTTVSTPGISPEYPPSGTSGSKWSRVAALIGLPLIVVAVAVGALAFQGGSHTSHHSHRHPGSVVRAPATLQPYTASSYAADIPAGWQNEEDQTRVSNFLESKWRDPSDGNSSVLVDEGPIAASSAQAHAEALRTSLARASDYVERSFGQTRLAGLQAWKWVFLVSGNQRVDYFLQACGHDFAVLGSTSPSRFPGLAPTFQAVAESLRATC